LTIRPSGRVGGNGAATAGGSTNVARRTVLRQQRNGQQAFDHLILPDATRKYSRIWEIIATGAKPFVEILADDLTDQQALKLKSR
jgi:hypothetical protein